MFNKNFRKAWAVLGLAFLLGGAGLLRAQEEGPNNDAIGSANLVQPEALAAALKGPAKGRPVVLHVGFPTLYQLNHIPGSSYAGPGSTAEGLKNLEKTVKKFPKKKFLVLYCGCCPWVHCPNVRPAFERLKALGFKNVKVMRVDQDFKTDWMSKGFAVQEGK